MKRMRIAALMLLAAPLAAAQQYPDKPIRMIVPYIVAPAGTPQPVAQRLYGEVARAAKLPDVRERLAAVALDPIEANTEQFGELVNAELRRWSKVIADAKIKPAVYAGRLTR